MSVKFYIYIFVTVIVMWSMNSININQIFKKNHVREAQVFYLLLGISIIYLVTSFIFDFFLSTKIV